MKKKIGLVIGLLVLVGLGYLAINKLSKKGKSDEAIAAFNFEIKDTLSIDRIIITESNGMEIELVRNGKSWEDKDGNCVQQEPVANILDAAYNVRFKGYVAEAGMKTIVNRMSTVGIKVQYFTNGEWNKTWYIGGSTPDHYGTFMLVESAEFGKSDVPVIAEIKGVKGIIEPRFFADVRRWQCSNIFAIEKKDIKMVNVNFIADKNRSFKLEKSGKSYHVTSNGREFPSIDQNMVSRYLLNYKRIHFNLPNFELNDKQLDSLIHSKPFCELTVKTTNNKSTKLRMFRRASESEEKEVNDFGETVDYDINNFWCELPSGQVVKCQYFVFNPLIMGHIYFNYQQKPAE